MQTARKLNADSEWDGIAQTMKKSFVKAQEQAEANQKELKKENQELNAKFNKEMAEIKFLKNF